MAATKLKKPQKMPFLNKNYINKFKISNTNTLVVHNGIYQPQLSNQCAQLIFTKQTLKIPKNSKIKTPIHLLFLTDQSHDSNIDIIAEENSSFTLVEEHTSLKKHNYTNNIKINITAKNNSKITYYKLQNENNTAIHNAQTHIKQKQNSKIVSGFMSQGAKSTQDILHIELTEKNASYNAIGIIALRDNQNLHYQTRIEHLAANCTSNIVYKGIVSDNATGNFKCLVVVHPNCANTVTHVTNKNLLLSELATMHTSPQLEIYADDVICTHGATVGQLDQNALFYLRSRGLAKNTATKLLTIAFAQEIINQFADCCRQKITLDIPHTTCL